MAMNKKERALLEKTLLENESLKMQMLGRSRVEAPEPFVFDRESWELQGQKVVEGWGFWAVLSDRSAFAVYRIWSEGYCHYSNAERRNGTQGAGILYRTKADALLAARAKLQLRFDVVLAQINQKIGQLEGTQPPS